MNSVIELLGVMGCLTAGIWLWRALRQLGLGPLPALALTLMGLWLGASLLELAWLSLAHAWFRWLDGLGGVGPWLLLVPVLVLLGYVGWRIWLHWQARRFFGP